MSIYEQPHSKQPIILLSIGFRPFFIVASIAAVVLILLWLVSLHSSSIELPNYFGTVAWHGHEMLFGYTGGVIAGFLLTAVRNWTGVATWSGTKLGLLLAVWIAGRLLPWFNDVPPLIITVVDLSFFPLLAIGLSAPLRQGKNRVNLIFIPLILAMAFANLVSHLQLRGLSIGLGDALYVMLDLVLLLIVLISGRVLPFFTRSAIPGFQPCTRKIVERLTFVVLLAIIITDLVETIPKFVSTLLWLIFALTQAVRLSGWTDRRISRIPVLWVLYTGYIWMIIGALLQGLAEAGMFPATLALHSIAIGVIGVFTLGMMARVTRGHTGRNIGVGKLTVVGFILLNLAALMRVFGPVVLPDAYSLWIVFSGAAWAIAFGLFTLRYVPRLLQPRIDGRPG